MVWCSSVRAIGKVRQQKAHSFAERVAQRCNSLEGQPTLARDYGIALFFAETAQAASAWLFCIYRQQSHPVNVLLVVLRSQL